MTDYQRKQAVSLAGKRLDAIERWTRRTFYAALSCAVLGAFLAVLAGGAAAEYLRAKWAMQEGLSRIATSKPDLSSPPAFATRRAGR